MSSAIIQGENVKSKETPAKKKFTDKQQEALKAVIDYYEKQETEEREKIVRECKELELFYRGFQDLTYMEVSKDFVDPSGRMVEGKALPKKKPMNIQKAYLDSIIAALSSTIPKTRFFPEDPENPLDIDAAEEFDKTAEKVFKDNDIELNFVYALFLLVNQGLVYWYTYNHTSEEYGLHEEPIYGPVKNKSLIFRCEFCGEEQVDDSITMCENCGEKTQPIEDEEEIEEDGVTGYEEREKTKTCIEFYGPLHVKTPTWIKSLKHSPYLYLYSEQSKSLMQELHGISFEKGGSDSEKYSKWGRSRNLNASTDSDTVTHTRRWFRPWALNCVKGDHEQEIAQIREMYPEGMLIETVEDQIVDCESSIIEEHWEATCSPLSPFMHAEPLARHIKPIQQYENETVRLTVDTLAAGIPAMFADPEYINIDAWRNSPAIPNAIYPAKKPRQGKLDEAFLRVQPATLSKEVADFQAYLRTRGEFISGAIPSVWGGQLKGGSGTFSEYEMSRNLGLQRLSMSWKILISWVPKGTKLSAMLYQQSMIGDETIPQEQGENFAPQKIQKALGRVGKCTAEASEQYPVSWPQLRQMVIELMGLGKDYVDAALIDPENFGFMGKTIAVGGLKIPGKADRDKQLREIRTLLEQQPFEDPMVMDQMGMPLKTSSIKIEEMVDNHQVQWKVIQAWAVSKAGLDAKEQNPTGYENVILHGKEHFMALQMAQAGMTAQGQPQPGAQEVEAPADGLGGEEIPMDDTAGLE